jgi:hypothetical protein
MSAATRIAKLVLDPRRQARAEQEASLANASSGHEVEREVNRRLYGKARTRIEVRSARAGERDRDTGS